MTTVTNSPSASSLWKSWTSTISSVKEKKRGNASTCIAQQESCSHETVWYLVWNRCKKQPVECELRHQSWQEEQRTIWVHARRKLGNQKRTCGFLRMTSSTWTTIRTTDAWQPSLRLCTKATTFISYVWTRMDPLPLKSSITQAKAKPPERFGCWCTRVTCVCSTDRLQAGSLRS